MSHTSEVSDTPFTDGALLEAAVKLLQERGIKASFAKGGVPRMWFDDQFTKEYGPEAEFTITLEECRLDVGFVKKDGKLIPVLDPHAGLIAKVLGLQEFDGFDSKNVSHHIRALTAEYEHALLRRKAKAMGHTIHKSSRDAKGNIILRAYV